MAFFSKKQKKLAMLKSEGSLYNSYKRSEHDLKCASTLGNEKFLKQVMKKHRDYEYAMLYQNTPQFQKKMNNDYVLDSDGTKVTRANNYKRYMLLKYGEIIR